MEQAPPLSELQALAYGLGDEFFAAHKEAAGLVVFLESIKRLSQGQAGGSTELVQGWEEGVPGKAHALEWEGGLVFPEEDGGQGPFGALFIW